MAYQLRVIAALPEDLSLVLRIHFEQFDFQSPVTLTPGDLMLSSHFCRYYIHVMHVGMQTYTSKSEIKS